MLAGRASAVMALRRRDSRLSIPRVERVPIGPDLVERAFPDAVRVREEAAARRDRAAEARDRAAEERDRAGALDRAAAAEDRRQAAQDRADAARELAAEGIDQLTGTLRRFAGMHAIEREMVRTRRAGEGLVIAFVDVVGLKRVNDSNGHDAGDALLREVSAAIRSQLRASDLVARVGGDEFVCSLSGQDVAGAQQRFAEISQHLIGAPRPAGITVGFAERRPDDTLEGLIRRADLAMIRSRRRERSV
jgi:diguanylate cyclase (GGDEF)-like protein